MKWCFVYKNKICCQSKEMSQTESELMEGWHKAVLAVRVRGMAYSLPCLLQWHCPVVDYPQLMIVEDGRQHFPERCLRGSTCSRLHFPWCFAVVWLWRAGEWWMIELVRTWGTCWWTVDSNETIILVMSLWEVIFYCCGVLYDWMWTCHTLNCLSLKSFSICNSKTFNQSVRWPNILTCACSVNH